MSYNLDIVSIGSSTTDSSKGSHPFGKFFEVGYRSFAIISKTDQRESQCDQTFKEKKHSIPKRKRKNYFRIGTGISVTRRKQIVSVVVDKQTSKRTMMVFALNPLRDNSFDGEKETDGIFFIFGKGKAQ